MKRMITCLLAAIGLSACGQQNFESTDVKGFEELLQKADVVLLDVRSEEEYAEAHLEGALLIDQSDGDFIEKVKAQVPVEKTIAIYCRSGRRSASAAGRLADQGYKVVNLKGGIKGWISAGKEVVR